MIERLLHWTALAGVALALAVAGARPQLVIAGWGNPLLPGVLHLVTLGGLLSLAYALQARLWRTLYGPRAAWAPLLWAVWAWHVTGVVLLVWGFLSFDTGLANLGGHYAVPTGIALALVDGWVAAWRRPTGTPRRLAAHLPGVGLAVAMSLGALLVMDAHTLRYGIYTLETILAHALAAGFLFVLPLLLLPAALEAPAAPAPADDKASGAGGTSATLRWYAAVTVGAGGVLAVVLALSGTGPPRLLPIGLALLGALLLWLGLPPGGRFGGRPGSAMLPLAGRLATGVLLFHATVRAVRGLQPGDALWLGKVGVLLFLLGMALPELLVLAERAPGRGDPWRRGAVWLAGTALLLAGQLWAEPWLVRAGAAVWLAGLAWHAVAMARR